MVQIASQEWGRHMARMAVLLSHAALIMHVMLVRLVCMLPTRSILLIQSTSTNILKSANTSERIGYLIAEQDEQEHCSEVSITSPLIAIANCNLQSCLSFLSSEECEQHADVQRKECLYRYSY